MLFGAPRHLVSIIRSPIMTDAVWYTPTCGITYSVSHNDGCCLVHHDMWYQLNAIRHHDGCRLVHPAKWEHFFNAIHYHDKCRLVHPAKWDIGHWSIPLGDLFDISTNSHLWRIPFNESHLYYHSHSFGFQISHFNSIFIFVFSFMKDFV